MMKTWLFHLFSHVYFSPRSIPYISCIQAPQTEAMLWTHQSHDIVPLIDCFFEQAFYTNGSLPALSLVSYSARVGAYDVTAATSSFFFSLCDIAVAVLMMQNNESINTKSEHRILDVLVTTTIIIVVIRSRGA